MKSQNIIAAILLTTVLTACGANTDNPVNETESPLSSVSETTTTEATSETTSSVAETEATVQTTSETTTVTETEASSEEQAEESETTTEITVAETSEPAETTTAAPSHKYDFKKGHKVDSSIPDIIRLADKKPEHYSYEEAAEYSWTKRNVINIEDSEIRDLIQNAIFLFCDLKYCSEFKPDEIGQLRPASSNPFYKEFEIEGREESVGLFSTYVNWESFIDYASDVFTEDFIYRLLYKECRFMEYNGELYCYSPERGIDPAYDNTEYSIYKQTDTEIILQRKTIHSYDDYYAESYNYDIKIIKTSDGWRLNNFLTVDDYIWDVLEDGTFYLTDPYDEEERAKGDDRNTLT